MLLPAPTRDSPPFAEIEITVEHYGLVRIRYRLNKSSHGRSAIRWFWTPCHAEQVGG